MSLDDDARAITEIKAVGVFQEFPAGARLFIAGAPGRAVYLVEDGIVKLVGEGEAGKTIVTCFRSNGSLIGIAPAIACRTYSVTAEAVHRVTVYYLDASSFTRLIDTNLHVSAYVNRVQSKHVCDFVQALCALALLPARSRLIDFLSRAANDLRLPQQQVIPIPPLLLRDIAAAIAVTPTHLSRLLRQLESEQLIQRKDNRIFVLPMLWTAVANEPTLYV